MDEVCERYIPSDGSLGAGYSLISCSASFSRFVTSRYPGRANSRKCVYVTSFRGKEKILTFASEAEKARGGELS